MPTTFYAEDSEFGTATGWDSSAADGTAVFDERMSGSRNLVITPHGEDDSGQFRLGDRYALTFNRAVLEDTVVIQREMRPGRVGAIVFEGTKPQGTVMRVVWTPDFDLTGWHEAHKAAGRSTGFYCTCQGEENHRFACFAEGSLIDTFAGPQRVEDLKPGVLIQTRDSGPQPLLWMARSNVPGMGRAAPVTIRTGTLGATVPVRVSARHRLLISDMRCEAYFGTSQVMIAARHLVDGHGVTRESTGRITYHHLLLERHEVIRSSGVLSESMLLGDDLEGVMGAESYRRFASVFSGSYPRQRVYKPARRILEPSDARMIRDILGLAPEDITVPPPSFLFAA
ncbi:Hint domain-containing protein [uncultured Tateyamaria sp.]|uniref:Hint domain-containing protein n=1 Tax=uncultured Tateyamaria sp. TaxID=455651 RepID=UPI0026112051|nr:Hint domain-containing protein [uncultured Tateyamaria sp.]